MLELKPQVLEFPIVNDERGKLSVVEGLKHIPFDIKRIYYLYDLPGGALRGSHAHKELEQIIISISGSFDVTLDDGESQNTFSLNRAYLGLYVPKMHWRTLSNFSSGSVCLVLASEEYLEDDYIRDYDAFLKKVKGQG